MDNANVGNETQFNIVIFYLSIKLLMKTERKKWAKVVAKVTL